MIHGDQFDSVVRYAKIARPVLGDWAYTTALNVNRWFNAIRRRLGYPYWSLSQWAKRQVKEAVKAIDRFEVALAGEARRRRLRRRGLRPYPPRRNAHGGRRAVSTTRATGWKAAPRWSSTMTAGLS